MPLRMGSLTSFKEANDVTKELTEDRKFHIGVAFSSFKLFLESKGFQGS